MGRESGENTGGSFEVDGQSIEIDMAEWGWDKPVTQQPTHDDDGRVRLQKALANAGIASRRACESLITGGRVTVNGKEQRELGSRVDPETDEVRVDGVVVQLDVSKRYFVLNKPRGVVSTMSDETGKPDLREFTDTVEDRLYNVGRLDTDTSGLLILTNDGDLAHKLAHPSFGVQKTYIAKVRGRVTNAVIQQLLDGIELKDGPIQADRAKLLPGGATKTHSLVEVTLHSGRNRIVRRMLAEVGHPVEELVRRQFGPLNLGTLRAGEMRELSAAERGALLSAVHDGEASGSDSETMPKKGRRGTITAGRPGDGVGARGMRGTAAKGNPHNRRGAGAVSGRKRQGDDAGSGRGGSAKGGSGKPGAGKAGAGKAGVGKKGFASGGSAQGGAGKRGQAHGSPARDGQSQGGFGKGGAPRGGNGPQRGGSGQQRGNTGQPRGNSTQQRGNSGGKR